MKSLKNFLRNIFGRSLLLLLCLSFLIPAFSFSAEVSEKENLILQLNQDLNLLEKSISDRKNLIKELRNQLIQSQKDLMDFQQYSRTFLQNSVSTVKMLKSELTALRKELQSVRQELTLLRQDKKEISSLLEKAKKDLKDYKKLSTRKKISAGFIGAGIGATGVGIAWLFWWFINIFAT